MTTNGKPIIQMDGIKKIFYTDEVETHALTSIHLDIQQGDYVSISGPSVSQVWITMYTPSTIASRGMIQMPDNLRPWLISACCVVTARFFHVVPDQPGIETFCGDHGDDNHTGKR